tara:strand:+ start:339 stop:443 length:105 start_codon:yes stop_codon:yes gene_type:complete
MKNEWNWMLDKIKPIGKSFPPKEVIKHLEELKDE